MRLIPSDAATNPSDGQSCIIKSVSDPIPFSLCCLLLLSKEEKKQREKIFKPSCWAWCGRRYPSHDKCNINPKCNRKFINLRTTWIPAGSFRIKNRWLICGYNTTISIRYSSMMVREHPKLRWSGWYGLMLQTVESMSLACISSGICNNNQTDHYVIMPAYSAWKLISFPAPSTVVQFFFNYKLLSSARACSKPRRNFPESMNIRTFSNYCFPFGCLAAKTVILIIIIHILQRSPVCCPSSVSLSLPCARPPSRRYDFLDLLIHKISMRTRRAKTCIQITFIWPFDWNTRARIFTT